MAEMIDQDERLRRDFEWFHRHPELALHEFQTTERIKSELGEIPGVELLDIGLKTGVLARITGKGKAIALRADIDALPITEESGVPYCSEIPGHMHACGHDFHTAALLGAARILASRRETLKGTVYLLFQPAEEAEQGGAKVADTGLFERYPIRFIYALHVKADLPVGTIQISEGAFSANVDRFRFEIRGKGCHASAPQTGLDPVPAAARLIVSLQEIVSRGLDPMKPAVVSVTHVTAGTTWNVIPESAEIEGTIRTFDKETRTFVNERMEKLAAGLRAEGYQVLEEFRFGCPATNNDPAAASVIRRAAGKLGFEVEDQVKNMGGEDFSCFQEKIPGALCHIGIGKSAPVHNSRFRADPGALPGAAKLLAEIAQQSPEGSD